MILSLFVSFHWVLLVAVNEVTQFGFLTNGRGTAVSKDNFLVTLWFNHTIYQNQFNSPNETNTWFQAYKNTSSPRFTILGSSHCNPESKIMFEQMNNGSDGLKFNIIQFYTESDDFYAIRSTELGQEFMCVDRVGSPSGCGPPKQIFYFDISRPNTYIEDAAHIDATSVTPQIETCDPTASPSKSPSNEPSVSPTRDPFEYEQFTIEINLNSCTNDGSEPCTFEETEDEINTILIAYLDESVTIVGTVIERGTIKVVLSTTSNGYEQLDRDRITNGIENELEREYGHDVEVTITKNEDEDDDDDDESNPFTDFFDSYGVSYVVVVALAIAICLIISLLLGYYYKRKTAKLRAEHMIASENTVKTNIGSDGCKDTGVGCKDNDINRFDPEALYGTGTVSAVVTKGVTTSGIDIDERDEGTEGSQTDGDESHDSERLYDVGATTVGATTVGATTVGATTVGATTGGNDC